MSDEREVVIARLGAQGDGVAETASGGVFVAGALPGERWRLAGQGAEAARLSDSPERRAPVCRHFGTCGGCIAQHMSDTVYRAWKQAIVADAFAHRGLTVEIAPVEVMPLHSRRRAVLGIANRKSVSDVLSDTGKRTHPSGVSIAIPPATVSDRMSDTSPRVEIGFREGGRHRLVDLAECPVLEDRIVAALPGLRQLAAGAIPPGDGGRLVVTATDTGLDVALSTGTIRLDGTAKARLAAAADQLGLARLEVEGEVVAVRAIPRLSLSGVTAEPPNGMFLQAVATAEERLVALGLDGIGKAKHIADLFCGVGTFTFPLARRAQVLAVDGDRHALAVLTAAQRRAQGLKPIETRRRDLFREPLSPQELRAFDAVVMDPPRAGAKAQSEALARSKVGCVVMVSCNPATLARDCRILVDAGFRLGTVHPIGQFVFSPHVEAVVTLQR